MFFFFCFCFFPCVVSHVLIAVDAISNRSNTRKSVSSDFQTPRSRLEKRGAAEFFLTMQLQGVWKKEETLCRVFDIASQTIDNSWRNSKQKFTKFYDNKDHIFKPPPR